MILDFLTVYTNLLAPSRGTSSLPSKTMTKTLQRFQATKALRRLSNEQRLERVRLLTFLIYWARILVQTVSSVSTR